MKHIKCKNGRCRKWFGEGKTLPIGWKLHRLKDHQFYTCPLHNDYGDEIMKVLDEDKAIQSYFNIWWSIKRRTKSAIYFIIVVNRCYTFGKQSTLLKKLRPCGIKFSNDEFKTCFISKWELIDILPLITAKGYTIAAIDAPPGRLRKAVKV